MGLFSDKVFSGHIFVRVPHWEEDKHGARWLMSKGNMEDVRREMSKVRDVRHRARRVLLQWIRGQGLEGGWVQSERDSA